MAKNKQTPSAKPLSKVEQYFEMINRHKDSKVAEALEAPKSKNQLAVYKKPKPLIMTLIQSNTPNRDIIRTIGHLTVGDVVGSSYPAISKLKKEHGTTKVENAIAALVTDASLYFEQKFTTDEALDIATEISTQHYYMSLEHIYVLLNRFKSTTHFGKLTPNKLMASASDFAKECMEVAATKSLDAHSATKESRINYDDPDAPAKQTRANEGLAQFKEKYNPKTPAEQTAEFEKWKSENPPPTPSIRTAKKQKGEFK